MIIDIKLLVECPLKIMKRGRFIWYRKDGENEYSTVVNDWPDSQLECMKKEIRKLSNEGRIYVRRDRPGAAITEL